MCAQYVFWLVQAIALYEMTMDVANFCAVKFKALTCFPSLHGKLSHTRRKALQAVLYNELYLYMLDAAIYNSIQA